MSRRSKKKKKSSTTQLRVTQIFTLLFTSPRLARAPCELGEYVKDVFSAVCAREGLKVDRDEISSGRASSVRWALRKQLKKNCQIWQRVGAAQKGEHKYIGFMLSLFPSSYAALSSFSRGDISHHAISRRVQQQQKWRYTQWRARTLSWCMCKTHFRILYIHRKKEHKAHTTAAEIRILCHAKVHQRSLFSTSRLRCTVRIRLWLLCDFDCWLQIFDDLFFNSTSRESDLRLAEL